MSTHPGNALFRFSIARGSFCAFARFRKNTLICQSRSRVLASIAVVCSFSACSSDPLVRYSWHGPDVATHLVATPSQKPGSFAGCNLPVVPAAIESDNKADQLQKALKRVRSQTWFARVALVEPANPAAEFDEAWLLVEKAKAAETAAKTKASIPDSMKPDAIEGVLLPLLPWASQTGVKPEAALQQRLLNIVQGARMLVDELTNSPDEQYGLNALLPPDAKPAGEVDTAQAGTNVPLKVITTARKQSLFGQLTDLASFRAFHLMALLSAARIHELLNGREVPAETLEMQVRLFNIARYLSAYFDAYFRGGQFIQFNIDESAFVTALSNDMAGKVRTGMTAAQIQSLIAPAFNDLCKSVSAKSGACGPQLGSSSFVTRAGLSVQFAGISYTFSDKSGVGLSHSYPQISQFGPQMIRVFVEAVFDANGQHLKGAPNSTACQAKENLFDPQTECLSASAPADDKLNQIDMLATGAEALTTTGTGVLVRGFAVASTNNELVAQMLETLAGVNARKITEKVLFLNSYGNTCPVMPVSVRVDTGHSDGSTATSMSSTTSQ